MIKVGALVKALEFLVKNYGFIVGFVVVWYGLCFSVIFLSVKFTRS